MWIKDCAGRLVNLNTGVYLYKSWTEFRNSIRLCNDEKRESIALFEFKPEIETKKFEEKFAELERLLIPNLHQELGAECSVPDLHNGLILSNASTQIQCDKIEIPPLTPKQIWENCINDFKEIFPYFCMDKLLNWNFHNTTPVILEDAYWAQDFPGISFQDFMQKLKGKCPSPFAVNWWGDWRESLHYKGEPLK